MNPNIRLQVLTISLLLSLVAGCANTNKGKYDNVRPTAEQEAVDPAQLVERTAALFTRSENLGLDFYAPSYYKAALDALDDAEAALKDSKRQDIDVVRACIAAKKLLEKAQVNRDKVDRNLRYLVKHRNLLLELDAHKWLPDDWASVSASIKSLVVLVENDEIQSAINQEPGVREDMYTLEIDTLLKSALDPARKTLAKAKEEQAEIYAPRYYNNADILIDDTQIYIRANYRDRKGIAREAELARLEAERALKTAIDVDTIFELGEDEAEPYLVAIKQKINAVVLKFQEQSLAPSTLDEALATLLSITENYTIEKHIEPEPEARVEEVYEEENTNDIEVLQVLDSLELDSARQISEPTGMQDIDADNPVEEQGFDDVEYME